MTKEKLIEELRIALSEYIRSEGCSCCQDTENHEKAKYKLGKLLNVEMLPDGSGYNFYKYLKNEFNRRTVWPIAGQDKG